MPPTTRFQETQAREQEARPAAGFGIGCYLEVTAAYRQGTRRHFILKPSAPLRSLPGTLDFGMGHATTYAQILNDLLGVPFDRIRMVEGDSDRMAFGGGSGGSRS